MAWGFGTDLSRYDEKSLLAEVETRLKQIIPRMATTAASPAAGAKLATRGQFQLPGGMGVGSGYGEEKGGSGNDAVTLAHLDKLRSTVEELARYVHTSMEGGWRVEGGTIEGRRWRSCTPR